MTFIVLLETVVERITKLGLYALGRTKGGEMISRLNENLQIKNYWKFTIPLVQADLAFSADKTG